GIVRDAEFYIIHVEEFAVLFYDGILRLGEYSSQYFGIQRVHVSEYRKPSYDFRDKPELFQVFRYDVLQQVFFVYNLFLPGSIISYGLHVQAFGDYFLYTVKSTSCNK